MPITIMLLPIFGIYTFAWFNYTLRFHCNYIATNKEFMLAPRQIKAARALLGWEAIELSKRTELSRDTIANIESGRTQPQAGSIERIAQALIDGGIEFTDNQGVRLRSSGIEVYEGPERFEAFSNFVYEQVKSHGNAHLCLSVVDERLFSKYRKDPIAHYERMQDLHDKGILKSFRILANQSNFASKYNYNTYKWQPGPSIAPTAFYTFTDCLALISFAHSNPPYVVVIRSAPLANSYRQAFDLAWAAAAEPPKPKGDKA